MVGLLAGKFKQLQYCVMVNGVITLLLCLSVNEALNVAVKWTCNRILKTIFPQ